MVDLVAAVVVGGPGHDQVQVRGVTPHVPAATCPHRGAAAPLGSRHNAARRSASHGGSGWAQGSYSQVKVSRDTTTTPLGFIVNLPESRRSRVEPSVPRSVPGSRYCETRSTSPSSVKAVTTPFTFSR
jgi:hypothetical protein